MLTIFNVLFLVWRYLISLGRLFIGSLGFKKRVRGWAGSPRFLLFNLAFSTALFGLGLYQLLEDRGQGRAIGQSEDEMAFGQIVPLALLSLSVLSGLEA